MSVLCQSRPLSFAAVFKNCSVSSEKSLFKNRQLQFLSDTVEGKFILASPPSARRSQSGIITVFALEAKAKRTTLLHIVSESVRSAVSPAFPHSSIRSLL